MADDFRTTEVGGRYAQALFDLADETAPHHPWVVRWNSGFAALRSLHGRLVEIDAAQARAVFGPLLDGIESIVQGARPSP